MRRRYWTIIVALVAVTAGCAMRPSLGRSRPDLAAVVSFDDGPLTFSRTYFSGAVGPFNLDDSRSLTRQRLSGLPLLDQDKVQLSDTAATWRVSLPAPSGGYTTYTLRFEGERIAAVNTFYSVFAGL